MGEPFAAEAASRLKIIMENFLNQIFRRCKVHVKGGHLSKHVRWTWITGTQSDPMPSPQAMLLLRQRYPRQLFTDPKLSASEWMVGAMSFLGSMGAVAVKAEAESADTASTAPFRSTTKPLFGLSVFLRPL